MITKIGQRLDFNSKNYLLNNKPSKKDDSVCANPIETNKVNSALMQKYYVSFGENKGNLYKISDSETTKFFDKICTQNTKDLLNEAAKIAKQKKHSEINQHHILLASLRSLNQYMNDLDSGKKKYTSGSLYSLPNFFETEIIENIFKDEKLRKSVKPIFEQEIKEIDKLLDDEKIYKKTTDEKMTGLNLSADVVESFETIYSSMATLLDTSELKFNQSLLLSSLFSLDAENTESPFSRLVYDLNDKITLLEDPNSKVIHLSCYDEPAKKILKNLSMGTNMFITYEAGSRPRYLIESIKDILKNQKNNFGNMSADNTEVIAFNNNIKYDHFVEKIKKEAKTNPDKNFVFVTNLEILMHNSASDEEKQKGYYIFPEDFNELLKEELPNVKFIFITNREAHLVAMKEGLYRALFKTFSEAAFLNMNVDQAREEFLNNPNLTKDIKEPKYTSDAISKIVELSSQKEGNFPDKTLDLMKQISAYFVNKNEITDNDVSEYALDAKEVLNFNVDNKLVKFIYSSNIKADDLIGKEATKKEVKAYAQQIKDKTLGTKGVLIYSQDGSVNAGRRTTAKAIAGEAKVPYFEIDAMDFNTDEISLLRKGENGFEKNIESVFSDVVSYAEANENKSAVLVIDNFDNTITGQYGYQSFMSILNKKIDDANKKGLNILVVGSIKYSEYIDYFREEFGTFSDILCVDSPAYNLTARKEILNKFIKEQNVQIKGPEQEQQKIINDFAQTLKYASFSDILKSINTAKIVAKERGHEKLEKTDFTEAYLRLTTGRTSFAPMEEHEKDIVTSHECGHALNLQIMRELAEKQNIPWRLPDEVNFISLDPRSWYLGVVYSKDGGNKEHSFEKIFSDLVFSYGGHSCEKEFYQMDGSWGITADIEGATELATQAVQIMGQGPKTGKISLAGLNMKPEGELRKNMDSDVSIFLNNALAVSDMITRVYADFNKEFTEKYAKLVGTGNCLIQGDNFRKELKEWLEKQSPEKREEIKTADEAILKIMEATKKGIKVKRAD